MAKYRPNMPLWEWRHAQEKTQEEIAGQVGVSTHTYLRWENGQSKPGRYARRKLATLTGLPLQVIMAAYEPLYDPEYEQNGSHSSDQAEAHAAAPTEGLVHVRPSTSGPRMQRPRTRACLR